MFAFLFNSLPDYFQTYKTSFILEGEAFCRDAWALSVDNRKKRVLSYNSISTYQLLCIWRIPICGLDEGLINSVDPDRTEHAHDKI